MTQLQCIFLDGMTGSGKTTVSTLLGKTMPRVALLGMDKIKRFLSDFERGTRDNTITRNVVFAMVQSYLEQGISVVLDQPLRSDGEIAQYQSLVQRLGGVSYQFQLYADPDCALQRVLDRQKNRERQVPIERIQHNISLFEKKEGWIHFDSTTISSEDIAQSIRGICSVDKR